MGSNGGGSGASEAYIESSEPLLGKSGQQEEDISSQNYGPIGYNHGSRYIQDIPFLIVFVILVLLTFAFGIFSIASHNNNYGSVGSYVYDRNSTTCTKKSSLATRDRVLGLGFEQGFRTAWDVGYQRVAYYPSLVMVGSTRHLLRDTVWTLVITLILSIPIISGLLWLLRTYTKQIVYACLPFFVLLPIFINVFWFVACTVSKDCREAINLALRIFILIFIFLLIGIIVWIIVANWNRIELTIRILRTGSEGLASNVRLLVVLPSLTIALFVFFVPIIVFLSYSRLNGKIVPNPKVVESGYACGGTTGVECCLWKGDRWVPAYFALAIITMIWSATTMMEAHVYIISGTVAQWYFHKSGSAPSRSITSSARNAFGPSFGTVCFSGLIFGVVRIVRAAIDSARRGQEGIVFVILRCCVRFVLFAVEFVNKFTINFAAITGESYCSSARMSYELLRRNLLSAAVVEAISTRILYGILFVVTVVYAIVVCAILKAATSLGGDAYFVTVLAWVLLFLILLFFVHILDDVVDTVYICYAMDKDRRDLTRPEIHDVYSRLPVSRDDTSFPYSNAEV
uniref:Choline transporter-like protein n=1 Tax=Araucaria cunninghamii TaxID=56994 RepID=A0A0D6QSQ4_ARACU